MKKSNVIILVLLFFAIKGFSQWEEEKRDRKPICDFKKDPFSIGVGGAFNTFIVQLGHEVRLTVPLSKFVNVVGEFYQYGIRDHDTAIFYRFKEYYCNLGLSAKVFQTNHFSISLRGSYLFTQWSNEIDMVRPANYNGMQVGVSADYNFKYFTVFFENTTNTVWWELNSMAGIKINHFPRIFSKPKNRYGNILKDGI